MIVSTTHIGVKDGKLDFFHVGSRETGGKQDIVLNWTFSDEALELVQEYIEKQKACGMM